jgi:hypothetical protein
MVVALKGDAGRRIADDDDLVTELPRLSRCGFDAELSGYPAEDDGGDAALAEFEVELRD